MKIAIFTDVLLEVPGGIGSSISAIKKALEGAGNEVLVFAPGWHPEKDPHIIVVPTNPLLRPNGAPWARRPRRLLRWLKDEHSELADFDLFHAHYEGPVSLAAIHLAREYHKPLIQTLHGREDMALAVNIPRPLQGFVAGSLRALHSRSLRERAGKLPLTPLTKKRPQRKMWEIMLSQAGAADLVITPSEHLAAKLRLLGLKRPLEVLPNGIDDDLVPIDPQPRSWRPEEEPLRIVWNSRLSHEKRFFALLEALKIAGERGLNYELSAYGSGNEMKAAQKFIEEQHLNVKLLGSAGRHTILRAIARSHLSAIASYNFDVHSLTLVEAEACGTPLFICDPDMIASLPEGSFIIAGDKNNEQPAYLSPAPSSEQMAEALLSLKEHPERIEEMSRIMLAHRLEVYQSARTGELLRIYESVLAKSQGV